MEPESTTFRLRGRHANHHTNKTLKFGRLSLNVNVVGSSTIHDVTLSYYWSSAHGLLPLELCNIHKIQNTINENMQLENS